MNGAYPLLSVLDLKKHFYIKKGFGDVQVLKAVDGVSFQLSPAEVLGVVGESGCGKTTLGRTVLRLYEPTSGVIFFDGKDVCHLNLMRRYGKCVVACRSSFRTRTPR